MFGGDRSGKLHSVHLAQIINQTTSYCWFLWAVLEASTNTATVVQREKQSEGILGLIMQAISCDVLHYYY